MKTSPPIRKNQSRPAAFLQVKHAIMNSKDEFEIKQAEKMLDRYILEVCEKPLREERKLDLQYIINWKVAQLREAGADVKSMNTHEEPILNIYHKKLEAK